MENFKNPTPPSPLIYTNLLETDFTVNKDVYVSLLCWQICAKILTSLRKCIAFLSWTSDAIIQTFLHRRLRKLWFGPFTLSDLESSSIPHTSHLQPTHILRASLRLYVQDEGVNEKSFRNFKIVKWKLRPMLLNVFFGKLVLLLCFWPFLTKIKPISQKCKKLVFE